MLSKENLTGPQQAALSNTICGDLKVVRELESLGLVTNVRVEKHRNKDIAFFDLTEEGDSFVEHHFVYNPAPKSVRDADLINRLLKISQTLPPGPWLWRGGRLYSGVLTPQERDALAQTYSADDLHEFPEGWRLRLFSQPEGEGRPRLDVANAFALFPDLLNLLKEQLKE